MAWILEWVQLDFIEFEDSLMKAYDGYYLLFCTPKFNISRLSNKVLSNLKQLSELYFGKDNFTLQILS